MFLFLFFLVIPLLEIYVFIKVGGVIGVGWTLFLTFVTAVIGSGLLRYQGLSTWTKAREKVDEDKFPLEEMFDGICLLVAGAFLLTPGFVTDTIGFLLFLPPFRALVYAYLKSLPEGAIRKEYSSVHIFTMDDTPGNGPRRPRGGGTVIEGEYETVEETEIDGEDGEDAEGGRKRGEDL